MTGNSRHSLIRRVHKGEFFKPCPGTTGEYLCCGYQVLTPMTGCGMSCAYCVLQVYFDHENIVVYDNFEDLEREIREKLALRKGVVRIGTGEFTDSLYFEDSLGIAGKIAALLEPYPNVLLEFKTKSVNISTLDTIRDKRKVIIGFSLNTRHMIDRLERGTASLEERFRAARRCEEMGFRVSFHFDPIVRYAGWEQQYREVAAGIFSSIKDPGKIAWISLGTFRTMPSLKNHLRGRPEYAILFSDELILGQDRKLRYFRPLRVPMYRAMDQEIKKHDPDATVYLCMESEEVWNESRMAGRIPGGLPRYLDKRAERILGLDRAGETNGLP